MMLHPGILALTLGSGLSLLLILYACRLAARILLRWDPESSSEGQLTLEREADLVATLVRCALGFEVVALLLFLYTADDLHPLFVGAMCATGTLNLDPAGWQALGARMLICFGAGLWLALEALDRRAEDAPLVRRKYQLLLFLAPLLAAAFWFQTRFFLALQPEVITSCCGALFGGGSGVGAELAALPVRPAMAAFYATLLLYLLAAGLSLGLAAAWPRYLLTMTAAAALPVSLAAIVSFVSLYIYQLPTHHCPFDLLQREYRYIGYPIYLSLFGAVHFGCLPGLCRPLRRIPSLALPLRRAERRWLTLSIACLLLFAGLVSWPVVMNPFTLAGYE